MYAVIQTGGKQYRVSEGTILKVEKLEAEVGAQLSLDQVLMMSDENGNVKIGDPLLNGASVKVKVLEQGKNKKILVYKYKKRKNYHKKQGHRQPFTKIMVEKIEG
jgi:large subunit ribosomal protein L21